MTTRTDATGGHTKSTPRINSCSPDAMAHSIKKQRRHSLLLLFFARCKVDDVYLMSAAAGITNNPINISFHVMDTHMPPFFDADGLAKIASEFHRKAKKKTRGASAKKGSLCPVQKAWLSLLYVLQLRRGDGVICFCIRD